MRVLLVNVGPDFILTIMRPLLLSLAVMLAAPPALAQRPGYARERAAIDAYVSGEVARTPIAGLAVAVVKGRDTLAMKGWGFGDLENDVPATAGSVFRIGSITKQFTSAAIMQLVEQGRLALTDTLGALLPGMPPRWRGVTLLQLLNHTSGIRSYTSLGPVWRRRWGEDMSPDTIVALVAHDSMDFASGSRWRYNNTGYVLLGMILDRTTGVPYPRYLKQALFDPLGLSDTEYCSTKPLIRHRAQGYDHAGSEFTNAEYLAMSQPYAAGALCSTVGDLVKWTGALHGGRVVSPSSFQAMTAPTGAAVRSRYGFGLVVDSLAGHLRVWHSGGINGFVSHLAYLPDDSLTIVVLSNTIPSDPNTIAANLARIVLGVPVDTTRTR